MGRAAASRLPAQPSAAIAGGGEEGLRVRGVACRSAAGALAAAQADPGALRLDDLGTHVLARAGRADLAEAEAAIGGGVVAAVQRACTLCCVQLGEHLGAGTRRCDSGGREVAIAVARAIDGAGA